MEPEKTVQAPTDSEEGTSVFWGQRLMLRVGQTVLERGLVLRWEHHGSSAKETRVKVRPGSQDHRPLRAEPKARDQVLGKRFERVCKWFVEREPATQGVLPLLHGTPRWASA